MNLTDPYTNPQQWQDMYVFELDSKKAVSKEFIDTDVEIWQLPSRGFIVFDNRINKGCRRGSRDAAMEMRKYLLKNGPLGKK